MQLTGQTGSRTFLWALTLVTAALAGGCGDESVEPKTPTTITISPASATLQSLDETIILAATVQDQDGQTMSGVTVTWTSGNEPVVKVDATGLVTAVGNGTAAIQASVEDAVGTAEVTVEQQPATVRVSPEAATLVALGDTVRLSGEAVDANGHVIEGVDINWSSEDESVVTVDVDGLVTAAGKGITRVRAVADTLELEGLATVKVDLHRGALLNIYKAMGGPGWKRSDNWETDAPLGEWYGVSTDAVGNVIELDLPANRLTGSIPPEIVALETLEVLKLHVNSISGPVRELEHLEHLQVLVLSANPLTGSIPPELGNLQNLRRLSLTRNQLTGSIPPELGNLKNLRDLELSENQFTGSIPAELGNLNYLEHLVLWNTRLTGSIPAELGSLKNLLELDLTANQLTGSIPAELGNLENLEQLEISDTKLSGALPPELGNLENLTLLEIHNTNLDGALPLELINVPLYVFSWFQTGLCAPTDESFQAWLDSITDHDGGPDCDDS